MAIRYMAAGRPEPRPYQELGRAIARARQAARLSQRELAPLIGVSAGYVPHLERGRRRPDPQILRAIARVLGVSYEELAQAASYMNRPGGQEAIYTTPDKAPLLRWLADLPLWMLEEVRSIEDVVLRSRIGRALTDPMLEYLPNPEAEHNRRAPDNKPPGEAESGGDEELA